MRMTWCKCVDKEQKMGLRMEVRWGRIHSLTIEEIAPRCSACSSAKMQRGLRHPHFAEGSVVLVDAGRQGEGLERWSACTGWRRVSYIDATFQRIMTGANIDFCFRLLDVTSRLDRMVKPAAADARDIAAEVFLGHS